MKSLQESLFDKDLVTSDIPCEEMVDRLAKTDINTAFDLFFDTGDMYRVTTLNNFLKTDYVYHKNPQRPNEPPICVIFLKSSKYKVKTIISFAADTNGCFKTTTNGTWWISSGWEFGRENDSHGGREHLYERLKHDKYDEYSVLTNKDLAKELIKRLETSEFQL